MRSRSSLLAVLLPAALVACGDDDGSAPGGPDAQAAAADAAGPDLGPVTIQVLWPHLREPAPDVPVVFYDPDGTIRSRTLTDEDGVATASILPGSAILAFIQVAIPEEERVEYHVRGVLGLEHGDSIVLRGPEPAPGLERSGQMTFVLPEHASAEYYRVSTSCGDSSNFATPEVTVRFHLGCNRSPMTVLALVDLGSQDSWELGYPSILATGVDRADGETVTIPGSWQDATTDPITLTDVPRSVAYAYALGTHARGADDSVPLPARGEQVSPMTDPMVLSLPRATAPEGTLLDIELRNSDRGLGEQRLDWWIEGAADGGMTTPTPPLLPWVGRALYEVDTRTFRLVRVGEGSWDTTFVRVTWRSQHGPAETVGSWILAAPAGRDDLTAPPVPDDLRLWDLDQGLDFLVSADLFDSDQLTTWDEARQLGLDGLWPDRARDMPVPSLVRLSTYQATF